MSVCATVAGLATLVAAAEFTLSWTHSVERTEWREHWTSGPEGLSLVEARVRGSGAGMDPGEGARLEDGWWVWEPALPAVASLVLAASGETGGGWTLCEVGGERMGCRVIGARAGAPTRLAGCESVPESLE